MTLTEIEKKRIIQIAEGVIQPETGFEKHFVNVCQGHGKACTPKEKEWFAYWQEYQEYKKSQIKFLSDGSTHKNDPQTEEDDDNNIQEGRDNNDQSNPSDEEDDDSEENDDTEEDTVEFNFSEKEILIICILAIFAKADGIVTKEEITSINFIMTELLGLTGESRRAAIQVFGEAKKNPTFYYIEYIKQFYEMFGEDEDELVDLLEMIFLTASSNKIYYFQHEQLIIKTVNIFKFPYTFYQQMRDRFFPEAYYSILECSQFDSDEIVKSQYRKLAKVFHPDLAYSKDLPQPFIDFATQKFKEIQEAYEVIKQIRGFSSAK